MKVHDVLPPGVEHFDARAGDVRLHCAAMGPRGGPLVLLLHGFPQCWVAWRHQLPALAQAGFRVVAPDPRGYGGSDEPVGDPRRVPHARVERIPGASHWVQADAPERANELLLSFLQ